ncbi:MAG: cysteine dioxygenase [Burkholderiales bacterium]|nr:MAG: cysteine dioxygenase [Burkholderiales bacterium]
MTPTDRHDPIDPLRPLRDFVVGMTRLVERTGDEPVLLAEGRALLATLISDDRWLPESCSQADPGVYRQYLLHCDPLERFSVVSFCWGPGARTPVHDHTVWGLVGVLRGAEACREYAPEGAGVVDRGHEHVMRPGMIEAVSPTVGDWHVVANAMPDSTSVSIHVYGANIGAVRRHRVDAQSGAILDFISGYTGPSTPNLWDRSAAVAATAR